jgi:hypothetical protein
MKAVTFSEYGGPEVLHVAEARDVVDGCRRQGSAVDQGVARAAQPGVASVESLLKAGGPRLHRLRVGGALAQLRQPYARSGAERRNRHEIVEMVEDGLEVD